LFPAACDKITDSCDAGGKFKIDAKASLSFSLGESSSCSSNSTMVGEFEKEAVIPTFRISELDAAPLASAICGCGAKIWEDTSRVEFWVGTLSSWEIKLFIGKMSSIAAVLLFIKIIVGVVC
jgi:hypothetical protein